MTRTPSRVVPLLLLAAAATAGCGLPEKVLARVLPRPTPTVAPAPTPTPGPVPPLKMEFVKVREERARGTAGTPSCAVEIRLVGATRGEVEAARVLVRTAVDDLGTNLVPAGAAEAPLGPVPGEWMDAPLVLPVPMKVASRKATFLREVSGEIELYVPGAVPAAGGAHAPGGSAGAPGPGEGLDPRRLPPNTLRRYRFSLKDVPLP